MLKSNCKVQKILGRGLLLVFMLSLLLNPLPVFAKSEYSDQAAALVVNIFHPNGSTTLVHEYSYGELESLAEIAYYATIDALPAAVGTKAKGVKIDRLIEHAAQNYNSNIAWGPGKQLRFYVTDSPYPYQPNYYTYENLYGKDRYYYPQLVETFDPEDPEEISLEDAVSVDPMLSFSSFQERGATDAELKGGVNMNSAESFRFCMGITAEEARAVSESPELSTTNKFARWVYRVDVGPLDLPSSSITGLELEPAVIKLAQGGTAQLTAAVIPADATNQDVTWSSSDRGIAAVNDSGLVTGVSAGTADITAAAAENPAVTKTCTVTVTDSQVAVADGHVAVTGIALDYPSLTLVEGKEQRLSALIKPYDATKTDIVWDSDKPAVAAVDSGGLVTAKTTGAARITATTAEGSFTAVCDVKVVSTAAPLTKIKLNVNSCNLKINDTKQLTVTLTPSDTTEAAIFWSSDQAAVATVDTQGLVRAIREGKTVIRAMNADGSVSDSCFVTVLKEDGSPSAAAPVILLTDIAGSWAQKNIEQMVEFGVLSGYPDGTFLPKKTVTRAEFVTMTVKTLEKLERVNGGFDSGPAPFGDTAHSWAKDYISKAVACGFVEGYSATEFGPDDEITREQMAAMIVKAFALPAAASQNNFVDQAAISPWARDAVAAIAASKIMGGTTGDTGNKFAPKDKATREEAAAVLCRVLQVGGYL